eukprot:47925-Rhodomonas_salina.1
MAPCSAWVDGVEKMSWVCVLTRPRMATAGVFESQGSRKVHQDVHGGQQCQFARVGPGAATQGADEAGVESAANDRGARISTRGNHVSSPLRRGFVEDHQYRQGSSKSRRRCSRGRGGGIAGGEGAREEVFGAQDRRGQPTDRTVGVQNCSVQLRVSVQLLTLFTRSVRWMHDVDDRWEVYSAEISFEIETARRAGKEEYTLRIGDETFICYIKEGETPYQARGDEAQALRRHFCKEGLAGQWEMMSVRYNAPSMLYGEQVVKELQGLWTAEEDFMGKANGRGFLFIYSLLHGQTKCKLITTFGGGYGYGGGYGGYDWGGGWLGGAAKSKPKDR